MDLFTKTKKSQLNQSDVKKLIRGLSGSTLAILVSGVLTPGAAANVTGNDTQNFNPGVSNPDFTTVHSSQPLPSGRFNFGFFLNQATNTLPYEDEESQSRTEWNDSISAMDVGIGYGVTKNLDLGLILPFVVDQAIDQDSSHGEFKKSGNTEVKAMAKFRALKRSNFGLAVIGSVNINRMEDNPYTGIEGGPVYNLELAADSKFGRMHIAGNIGYRFREPGEKIDESIVEPLGNQFIASAAISYKITKKGYIVSEIFAAQDSDLVTTSNRDESSAEWIAGYKHHMDKLTVWHIGAGTEFLHGISTPDWRIYAGVHRMLDIGSGKKGRVVAKKKKRVKKKRKQLAAIEEDFAPEIPEEFTHVELPMDEPLETIVLKDVKFEFNSDFEILEGGITELEKVVERAREIGATKLVIEGHTDFKGTEEYNYDLSLRRAKTVRTHLMKRHGYSSEQVIAVGYGEDQPKTFDTSDRGRQINRRVEIKMYQE